MSYTNRLFGHLRQSPTNVISRAMALAQPYPADEHQAAYFRAQQLRMLAKLGMATIPAQLLAGLMLAWSVHDENPVFSMGWGMTLGLLSMAAMLRLVHNIHLQSATQRNLYTGSFLILCVAALWGALPLVTLPTASDGERLAVLLAMACMASSGSVIFQHLPVAAIAWVLILSTCTSASMLSLGLPHAAEMSAIAAVYSWVMIRNIWMTSRLFFVRLHMSDTERKQAQITARQALIGQSISNCVLLLDRTGRITWINKGFTRCLGYTFEDAYGRMPDEWLEQNVSQAIARTLWRRLVTRRHAQAELRCISKDGSWLWLKVDITYLSNDEPNAREYLLVANDITELKRIAEALHEEKERQRHIIDGTHCGTWEIDFKLNTCKVGGHWLDIMGLDTYEPVVMDGWPVLEKMHPDDLPGHFDALRRYICGETNQYSHEHRIRHAHGNWHWVSTRGKASGYGADGLMTQMSGITTDISKSKATELALLDATCMARQANHAKSMFLATMSHEIRTPMNGVIGTAEWLNATQLDEEQREGLQTIVDCGRSLLTIIDDILDFTKVEAGHMKLEDTPVTLADLAESVSDAITPVAVRKHVHLHLFIDPNLPHQVMGDPNRLRQVLFNLVGNAVKFGSGTEREPGHVDVQLLAPDTSSEIWQMTISDDGIGMTPQDIEKVFTPFTQAETSTTRRFGGTGLGLAICHRLVELMGGAISAHSTPGRGSTFTVTMPLRLADGASMSVPVTTDLQGVTCLVMPGENYRSNTVVTYLAHAGARIHCCLTMDDALTLSTKIGPAILIRDTPERSSQVDDASADHLKQLWVGRYQHGPVRLLSPRVGQLGRAHVQDLLSAVAVLAGRQWPEDVRSESSCLDEFRLGIGDESHWRRSSEHQILIVEDDPTNQTVIQRQLQMLGFSCQVAGNGLSALALWRSKRFDLVLSDLHMPEMDGYELTEHIRTEEATRRQPRTPILALTANALSGEEIRAQACGMDDYLTKPIALKELYQRLKRWLPAHDTTTASTRPDAHVNLESLYRLVGRDEDVIQDLLLSFVATTTRLGNALTEAIAADAHDQTRQAAHQLKSAARSVGAQRLAQLCEAAETCARSNETKPETLHELMEELQKVRSRLDTLIKEPIK